MLRKTHVFILLSVLMASVAVLVFRADSGSGYDSTSIEKSNRLSYCGNDECLLDVYLPSGQGNFPVAVFFRGEKELVPAVLWEMREAGWAVIVVSVTGSEASVKHEDAQLALKWIEENASVYSIDTGAILLSGKKESQLSFNVAKKTSGAPYVGLLLVNTDMSSINISDMLSVPPVYFFAPKNSPSSFGYLFELFSLGHEDGIAGLLIDESGTNGAQLKLFLSSAELRNK